MLFGKSLQLERVHLHLRVEAWFVGRKSGASPARKLSESSGVFEGEVGANKGGGSRSRADSLVVSTAAANGLLTGATNHAGGSLRRSRGGLHKCWAIGVDKRDLVGDSIGFSVNVVPLPLFGVKLLLIPRNKNLLGGIPKTFKSLRVGRQLATGCRVNPCDPRHLGQEEVKGGG